MNNVIKNILNTIPYHLIHISKSENIEKIYTSNHFIPSIHNPEKGKIQWLGDGVYFWDQSDYASKKLGKALARGKFRGKKLYGICISIIVEDENYLNLEDPKWAKKFKDYLWRSQPNYYEKINDYLVMIKERIKPNTSELNELGELLGTCLNSFIKILQNEYDYEIEMVSAYFYHETIDNIMLQRKEKIIQQFCIRNINKLNESIKNCEIVHID